MHLTFSRWLCLAYRNGLTMNGGDFIVGVYVCGWMGHWNVVGAEELVNFVDGWQWKKEVQDCKGGFVTYIRKTAGTSPVPMEVSDLTKLLSLTLLDVLKEVNLCLSFCFCSLVRSFLVRKV